MTRRKMADGRIHQAKLSLSEIWQAGLPRDSTNPSLDGKCIYNTFNIENVYIDINKLNNNSSVDTYILLLLGEKRSLIKL